MTPKKKARKAVKTKIRNIIRHGGATPMPALLTRRKRRRKTSIELRTLRAYTKKAIKASLAVGRSGHADPDWGWTRKAIANLLAEGFRDEPSALRFAEPRRIWAILRPLTDDPDPTPAHEEEYGGKNMDQAQISINTVRGEAFHAPMQYALWVRRSLDAGVPEDARLPRSFDVMPEVREVLEAHLDAGKEPSLTNRSVYGRWLSSCHRSGLGLDLYEFAAHLSLTDR